MELKSIKRELEYIPEFNGNRDLPESKQLKVLYKDRPTAADIRILVSKAGNGHNIEDEHIFCSLFVDKIVNLKIDGENIDTFSKLIEVKNYGVVALAAEIGADLIKIDGFEEGEE